MQLSRTNGRGLVYLYGESDALVNKATVRSVFILFLVFLHFFTIVFLQLVCQQSSQLSLCKKRELIGGLCGGGTPGSIPNPAVKPASADGTWGATPWESRSLPILSLFLFPYTHAATHELIVIDFPVNGRYNAFAKRLTT